jgi:hypothetical protein
MSPAIVFDPKVVAGLQARLNAHPIYSAVRTMDDLRLFMAHHVYSVWDFMSILKYLQYRIAPATYPWKPRGSSSVRFFINQIVVGEESDDGLPDADGNATYASHFELYCDAMREVGVDPAPAIRYAETAADRGVAAAAALGVVPAPASRFMQTSFDFIATDKAHVVGAAFALGREHIIPEMFRALLGKMNITQQQAPVFHYYLERHIHLDEDFHAPLALRMINELIGGDALRLREAEAAAMAAIEARIALWDGVLAAIESNRKVAA